MSSIKPQRLSGLERLSRHRHGRGYVALVVEGSYSETGDVGRRTLAAGDVAIHMAFQAHANIVSAKGARVVNLDLTTDQIKGSFARLTDPDSIIRLAERGDEKGAVEMLVAQAVPLEPDLHEWPDRLAAELRRDAALSIDTLAVRFSISPSHLSRAFRAAYGVSPSRYRLEQRSLEALRRCTLSEEPLAQLASDLGFSDQAHMTRSVRALSGRSPGAWRTSNRFKPRAPAHA